MMTPEQDDDDKASLLASNHAPTRTRGRFSFLRRGGNVKDSSESLTTTLVAKESGIAVVAKETEPSLETGHAAVAESRDSFSSEESTDNDKKEPDDDKSTDSDDESNDSRSAGKRGVENKKTGLVVVADLLDTGMDSAVDKSNTGSNKTTTPKQVNLEETKDTIQVVPFVSPPVARLNPPVKEEEKAKPSGRFWRFRRSPKEQRQGLLENCEELDEKAHGPVAVDPKSEPQPVKPLEGFGSSSNIKGKQQSSSALLGSFQLGRLMARSRSNVNPLSEEEKQELEKRMAASQLSQMKIKGEPCDKDWKEKASDTIAKVLVPEIYCQEQDGEGNLGRYCSICLDDDDDEQKRTKQQHDNADNKMTQDRFLSRHVQALEATISELRAQLMIKDLEALGWKQRAKELEREVKRLGGEDESLGGEEESTDEEESTIDTKEGNLLDLQSATTEEHDKEEEYTGKEATDFDLPSTIVAAADHENVIEAAQSISSGEIACGMPEARLPRLLATFPSDVPRESQEMDDAGKAGSPRANMEQSVLR